MPDTAHHRGTATPPVGPPERSSRPICPTVGRSVRATADALSSAWTEGGGYSFAAARDGRRRTRTRFFARPDEGPAASG